MSESTDAAAGGRRGGRTVSKSTPDEVMELACGLPLTRSVLRSVVAGATPGQLGVLADLFRAENASRTESRRARLIRNAGFPCVKGFDGYDWGMASFPADWGREQLMDLGFVDRAEDLVLYGDVGCGKTHMAIATGMLACERGMPVRFFTASSLVMRLRRARDENRLDAELRAIGRARLLVIDELGYLRSTSTGPGSCSRSSRIPTRSGAWCSPRTWSSDGGARCSETATWPPRSSTASCTTEGSSGSVASHTATATP